MSNTQKSVTPTDIAAAVPSQSTGENLATTVQDAVAANTMIDALKKVEDQLAGGVTVKIQVAEDGSVTLDVVEDGKAKKLVAGAKGLFNRNKKLVLATVGLAAVSVVLKVVASRQVDEDGELTTEVDSDTNDVVVVKK